MSNEDELALMSVLPQIDTDENISPDDADEILNGQDSRSQSPTQSESNNTQHTAVENPTFTLPIAENPLNHYTYRLEIRVGDQYDVSYQKPFKRHHS